MSLLNIALFLHVVGAVGYSVGIVISPFGLWSLRRAGRVEQARPLLNLLDATGPISGISLLVNVIAGFYMTTVAWGWRTPWIDVALGSLLLLMLPTGAVMGIRRHALVVQVDRMPDGPLPDSLRCGFRDPVLGTSTIMLVGLVLGIFFLMSVKPALVASLIVMGIALVVSLVVGLALSGVQLAPIGRPAARQPGSVSGC